MIDLLAATLVSGAALISGAAAGAAPLDADERFTAAYLIKRKPGMPFEEFETYSIEVHAPLARALPGLLAYELFFFRPGDEDQPYDAMALVTFESQDAHDAALASDEGQRALGDLPNYANTDATTVMAAGPGTRLVAPK